jgi:hypothetical protein
MYAVSPGRPWMFLSHPNLRAFFKMSGLALRPDCCGAMSSFTTRRSWSFQAAWCRLLFSNVQRSHFGIYLSG